MKMKLSLTENFKQSRCTQKMEKKAINKNSDNRK